MAAFDFPNSPNTNDVHTENGVSFKWDGTVWKRQSGTGAQGSTGATGSQGAAGAQGDDASLTMSTGAPGSPDAGDLWWDSDSGILSAYYNDGDSNQWVEVSTGPIGPTGAQGATGSGGSTGAQGHQGAQGAQGHQGATGGTGAQGSAGSATISSNADNRVITGGSGTNLVGESNLTFSGSTLKVNSTTGHSYLKLNSNDSYSGSIHFGDQSDDDAAQIWYDNYQSNGMNLRTSENAPMSFYTNGTQRLRIDSSGGVIISNAGTFPTSTTETLYIQGEGHNGHGTTNTRSVFNIIAARTSNSNAMGLWVGARTNENTVVVGTRTSSGNLAIETYNGGWGERLRIRSDGHVVPGANNTYDFGSTSLRWRNIYTNDLNLSNKGSTNSVDNTWGDFTIEEGESDLFLINNRSGKKYKFNLTEVS